MFPLALVEWTLSSERVSDKVSPLRDMPERNSGVNARDVAEAILKGRRGNMYDARRFA